MFTANVFRRCPSAIGSACSTHCGSVSSPFVALCLRQMRSPVVSAKGRFRTTAATRNEEGISTASGDPLAELTVYTIGHSTRSSEEFVGLLEASRIEMLVDVRRMPGSRRLPQFDSATLSRSLSAREIDYCWISQPGGRRRPQADSPNTGWRHAAFRAYADHMVTDEFADGLFELLMLAHGKPTVMMCAEVLWWRCHRRLIADALPIPPRPSSR